MCVYKGISEEPAHITIIISEEKQNKLKIDKIKFEFIHPPTLNHANDDIMSSWFIYAPKVIHHSYDEYS